MKLELETTGNHPHLHYACTERFKVAAETFTAKSIDIRVRGWGLKD